MSLALSTFVLASNNLDPQMLLRLGAAAGLGLIIGIERERPHRAAGMRTHALVALGSALFVLATSQAGAAAGDTSRVIQGVVQGIGFLGAGTILKLTDRVEVRGLTTAAGIWVTAAVGVSCALGEYWLAFVTTLLAWLALKPLKAVEQWLFPSPKSSKLMQRTGGATAQADPDDS
ncbi:MAG TPA: MgtC/SapB family protein [Phycisphaerales bacterium]|jgi:putative Mg2+ transporter-C (MgtC) family protein|nr:MgtC/SapB family protein [Phycisphaerales bacterium]